MKRILFALLAIATLALCACDTPSGTATVTTSPSASPSTSPSAAAFDAIAAEKTVTELEKKTWTSVKDKDVDTLKKIAAPGLRSIYFGEINDAEAGFNDIKNIEIKSITFSDWKVTFPINSTAIVTYKYTASSAYKGKDTSGAYAATATWTNINGEWKQAVYAETRAEKSAPPAKK